MSISESIQGQLRLAQKRTAASTQALASPARTVDTEDAWCSIADAARAAGIPVRTLRYRVARGQVPSWRPGGSGAWKVSRAWVEDARAQRIAAHIVALAHAERQAGQAGQERQETAENGAADVSDGE